MRLYQFLPENADPLLGVFAYTTDIKGENLPDSQWGKWAFHSVKEVVPGTVGFGPAGNADKLLEAVRRDGYYISRLAVTSSASVVAPAGLGR